MRQLRALRDEPAVVPSRVGAAFRARARKVRERARLRGECALGKVVEFWLHVLQDPREKTRDRMDASRELASRFGLPALQAMANLGDAFSVPKLYVEARFDPPPEWNGLETNAAVPHAEVVDASGAGDQVGNGEDGSGTQTGLPEGDHG